MALIDDQFLLKIGSYRRWGASRITLHIPAN